MLNKIIFKIKLLFHSLFFGLKGADTVISKSEESIESPIEIKQNQIVDNVFADLLRGEITKEVEELRYMTYILPEKSKEYRYIGGGKAKKIFKEEPKFLYKEDGENITIVQNNYPILNTMIDDFEEINVPLSEKMNYRDKYKINILRDFRPHIEIEPYISKVVIKKIDNNNNIIEFYISKHKQNMFDTTKIFNDSSFYSDIKRIMNGDYRIDFLKMDEIKFITENSYGSMDGVEFSFIDNVFDKIVEYNGFYILRFKCHNKDGVFGKNLIEDVYSPELMKKYKNKEPRKRNTTFNSEPLIYDKEYRIPEDIDLKKLKMLC